MNDDHQQHAAYVQAVAEQRARPRIPGIARSFERCREEYGLDPEEDRAPPLLSNQELSEREASLGWLGQTARAEVGSLQRSMAESGCVVLLCDADGVILLCSGDRGFAATARGLGLRRGALWSERAAGTNALGTSLREADALEVQGTDHFFSRYTGLAGAGAPVSTPEGRVAAALGAYGHTGQPTAHALALLKFAVENIENRTLARTLPDGEALLGFHSRAEFAGATGEGLLRIDHAARITGANRSAAFHLGCASPSELVGRQVPELLSIPMSNGSPAIGEVSPRPEPVYETQYGRRFFARLIRSATPVRPTAARPQKTAGPTSRKSCSAFRDLDDLDLGDPAMAESIRAVRRLIDHELPILIHGETGTGKEIFAKALHHASSRAGKEYVGVNCASIPETLIESELFGYKAGAFTGANKEGNRGKIVQADGGTLFLDEIGDMPLALQGRLLRVLEERTVLPLGGNTPVKVDIQLVSATNRDLTDLIRAGQFREDLYYRLQGLTVHLPPLRERQDRRALIKRLLEVENDGEPVPVEERAMERLVTYPWPGNIRQLCSVLRIMLAMREADTIRLEDLPADIREQRPDPCAVEPATTPDVRPNSTPLSDLLPLKDASAEALTQALEGHYWSVTKLARRLGVSRNTIYRRMKQHGIQPPRAR